jgi:hypothetical protein
MDSENQKMRGYQILGKQVMRLWCSVNCLGSWPVFGFGGVGAECLGSSTRVLFGMSQTN